MHGLGWYALGVGTAIVASVGGKPIGRALRPAAKRAVKGGLLVSREVQRRSEEARSTLNDLVAEANAEIEAESERPAEDGQP